MGGGGGIPEILLFLLIIHKQTHKHTFTCKITSFIYYAHTNTLKHTFSPTPPPPPPPPPTPHTHTLRAMYLAQLFCS